MSSKSTSDETEFYENLISDRISATDRKAALADAWSKKLGHSERNQPNNYVVGWTAKFHELTKLPCIHEAVYDAAHKFSHENALNLPSQDNSVSGNPLEDRVILIALVELLCAI